MYCLTIGCLVRAMYQITNPRTDPYYSIHDEELLRIRNTSKNRLNGSQTQYGTIDNVIAKNNTIHKDRLAHIQHKGIKK